MEKEEFTYDLSNLGLPGVKLVKEISMAYILTPMDIFYKENILESVFLNDKAVITNYEGKELLIEKEIFEEIKKLL